MRYFGARGHAGAVIADHMRLARAVRRMGGRRSRFRTYSRRSRFSVVCFRALPRGRGRQTRSGGIDAFNDRLMELVNASARCSSLTRGCTAASRCGSRSDNSARPKRTSRARGHCCARRRRRACATCNRTTRTACVASRHSSRSWVRHQAPGTVYFPSPPPVSRRATAVRDRPLHRRRRSAEVNGARRYP